MTVERMLELYLLTYYSYTRKYKGKTIDKDLYDKRRLELLDEFLEPYVINNTEKSE